jgi:hypothetical protein
MGAAARWLGGIVAACSAVVGSHGADTIYKFTTISDAVCRDDHEGALELPSVTSLATFRLSPPPPDVWLPCSLHLRPVLRRGRSGHPVPERRAATVGAGSSDAGAGEPV